MTSAAAGAARTLAASPDTGTPSKLATTSGATPSWAEADTATGSTTAGGPGSTSTSRGPSTRMPSVAATERWKPVEPTRRGSTSRQPGHGQAEQLEAGCRPAPGRRHRRTPGHGDRPQHRGLAPGQHHEQGEEPGDAHDPPADRQALEQRSGHGQDEGDVLARHGQEVRQTRAAEVVHEGRRLVAVVAQDEPDVERSAVVAQVGGPVGQQPPQPVGDPPRGCGGGAGLGPRHGDGAGDVAHAQPGGIGGRRSEPAGHSDALARQPHGHHVGRGTVGLEQDQAAVEPGDGLDPAEAGLGIADQGHLGVDRGPIGRGQTGLGPGPERRGGQGGGHDQQARSADGHGEGGDDGRHQQRQRVGDHAAARHRRGQHQRPDGA